MAGTQTNNILLLDLTTGLPRTNETGVTPDILQLSTDFQLISGANMLVDGDLVVNGTTTTVHSEQVNIADNHLYLNADYTTTIAQTGGLVINVLPTSTADTVAAAGFTAGVPAVSNPTVVTLGTATFAPGDVVQIAGANNQANDGIFEVLSHVGTTLTIRGVGVTGATVPWVTNQFETDATGGGDIRIVTVNVLEGDSSGNWNTATVTTTTGITYNTFTTQGLVDLQEAYEQGNTITTSAGDGNVVVAGTELLLITATGGLDLDTVFDADVTTFDVQMTGLNGFSIDGTAASNVSVTSGVLTLSTLTAGNVAVTAADAVVVTAGNEAAAAGNVVTLTAGNGGGANNGGAVTVTGGNSGAGATGNGGAVNLTAGTATSTNGNGGNLVLTTGDGTGTGSAGTVSMTGPNSESEAIAQLTTTGTNGDSVQLFVGDSDPNGLVTGLAGSLFFRDTGVGAELYLNTSAGSGTTWTALSTAAGATLQSAYEAGNTITTSGAEGNVTFTGTEDFIITLSDLLVDTTASISLDADTASNFTVDGASLTLSTTTSGNVVVTAADAVNVTAGNEAAATGNAVNVTAGNGGGANNGGAVNLSAGVSGAGATGNGGAVVVTAGDATSTNGSGGVVTLMPGANTGTGTHGFVHLTGTNNEGEALAQLTTTGTAGDSVQLFVGDNSPNGTVTGLAGSLFFRDTGTTGELWLNVSTGSGTTWQQVVTAGSGTLTLQSAYEGGNTISVSAAEGVIDFSNSTDATNVLEVSRTFAGAGVGIDLNMGATTTGIGLDIDTTAGATGNAVDILNAGNGDALFINNTGTGAAFTVQDGGADVLDVSAAGAVTVTPTSGQTATITVAGAGSVDINAGAGGVTIDGTGGGISIDSNTASNFTVTGASLTLSTAISGTVDITSADDIQVTFETANATAMVIDDGTNNYITFDSTASNQAVEVNQFLDIVGSGAGVTLTAGEAIAAADVIALEDTTGDAVLADANTGTTLEGLAIGVAAFAAADTTPVKVYTVAGSLIPIAFSAAPAATSNGSPVFVSGTPGRGTLVAPVASGSVVYLLGILQGADGATTTPLVLFQPQFIAVRP